ncbi:MAG: N-acetylmuramoyl-L-alanine amidase [Acidobacteriia bacterium]|nr:N-acetylmuramoyl-L-alanine amidase [Terriglobia bacterium]
MSANPTRVDWEGATAADLGSPLQEGNRVLESIARQEALRALLAFSDLHEQIRKRRAVAGRASDRDLFETERFILDEVLQLITDRAQTITQADGVVVALAEKSADTRSKTDAPEMVCRAAAGPLAVPRGVHWIGESEFLRDCLESGRILRCDDCEIDARVEQDFAHAIGARSTVLVPLGGRGEQIGVLQAFSTTARAFTDHDVRCFDLFSELVLSALKPEDQDRRIHWLSDVADEVLRVKPAAAMPTVAEAAAVETETAVETGLAPSPTTVPEPPADLPIPEPVPELAGPAQPIAISADLAELTEAGVADEPLDTLAEIIEPEPPAPPEILPFPCELSLSGSSRAGLRFVMGAAAVVALFSAGAWWGMQVHEKTAATKDEAANTATSRRSVTTPSAPPEEVLSLAVSDNLMNPSTVVSASAPLAAVAEDKLAALPKITGVRHWSSSMGSTVVIDMEDQVPYEVHRLMSPERIYFDLHDTVLSHDLDGKTMDVGDASLSRVRIAQPVAGVTRIVLDTKDGSNFSVSMESSPYRLVVELRGSEKTLAANHDLPSRMTANQTSALVNPAPGKAAPVATLGVQASDQPLPAKTGKFRIVLDAGHGGWDLGTVGRQGLLEKDLVLDVTQRLGKLLQARLGSEVMLTRTGDTYLSLDQRADFANQAQADLFVSIHANYSSSATARGVETYYTNLFSAPGSREVDKQEDGTFAKLTPASLSADALHEKIEESRRLAASVQRALYAKVAASGPDIRNRGIKDRAFAVLTGTTMPAILTEISFVSSPTDERNLQSATYRQQIAEALFKGIARYEEASPPAKVAQLQKPGAR